MLPGRLIGMDGYGALATGQLMIGLAAPLLVVPFLAALLTRWFSHGLLSAAGLLTAGGGLLLLEDALAQGGGLLLPMGLIGAGIGLPWGLMDALAVSVVDKDKVGMATGIFNTVRVSADGVAIAVLSALLAFLIQARLGAALPADPRWPWPRTAPRWASWPRRPPCCQARPTCCARATARPSASCCGCWRPSRR